jgi:hypothetical protein
MTVRLARDLMITLAAVTTGTALVATSLLGGSPAAGAADRPAGPAATTGHTVWRPAARTDWMWELSRPLKTTSARLMGTGVTAWNGDGPPGDNPALYDIDAIENPAATVARLHRRRDYAVCYIEVGSAGNYYTARQERTSRTYFAQLKAAGDLGRKLPGYPEYFININARSAVSIIKSMIRKQCAAKRFDGVETDLDETYGTNEGRTGFKITKGNEEHYLEVLAHYMHRHGLAWIAKNLDDTGSASFVRHLEPLAQGVITEQCRQHRTCPLLRPFRQAGKWIGDAEYAPETRHEFCAKDNAEDFNGILFRVSLNGGRKPCR